MRGIFNLIGIAAAFAAALVSVQAHAEGAVSPDVVELVIQPGSNAAAEFQVIVQPLEATYEPLDIAFVFDGTASMGEEIAEFQRSIDTILNQIARRSRNVRYAVAQFADHADLRPCGGPLANARAPVWRLLTDFTADPAVARAAVNRTAVYANGCDIPEAYLEALAEVRQLSWRREPEVTRYVIIVGDAPARSPDRGFDDVFGTADDLNFQRVTSGYRSDGITIVGIYAPGVEGVDRSFAMLAGPTSNGMAIPLSQGTSVADAIELAILVPPPPPPAPYMRGTTPAIAHWLSSAERHTIDAGGLLHRFTHAVEVPLGTASGIYEIDLEAFAGPDGDGPAIGAGRIILKVGWEYYPIRSTLRWVIAAVAFFALTFLLARRSRSLFWGLEFQGAALKQTAGTYLIAAAIIVTGVLAWRSAPEDYDSLEKTVKELRLQVMEALVIG